MKAGMNDHQRSVLSHRHARAARLSGMAAREAPEIKSWLKGVIPVTDGWRFVFGRPRAPEFSIRIVDRTKHPAGFAQTDALSFSHGEGCYDAGVEKAIRHLVRRWRDLDMLTLDQRLLRDEENVPAGEGEPRSTAEPNADDGGAAGPWPDAWRSAGEGPPPGDDDASPLLALARGGGRAPWLGLHQSWNHPEAWRHFLADSEDTQDASQHIRFRERALMLNHAPFDCTFLCPRGFITSTPMSRSASDDASEPEAAPRDGPSEYFSNIRDMDVINGADERVAELFEAVEGRSDTDVVLFYSGCVPQLIGDDFDHLVAQASCKLGCPVLVSGSKSVTDPLKHQLEQVKAALADRSPGASAGGLRERVRCALVGYGRGRDVEELFEAPTLGALRLGARLIPDISVSMARSFCDADVRALAPIAGWRSLYEELTPFATGPSLEIPLPYGPTRYEEWSRALLISQELDPAPATLTEGLATWRSQRWEPLVTRTQGKGIGIAFGRNQLARLLDPGLLWGVPMLALLQEMGFQVHLGVIMLPGEDPAWSSGDQVFEDVAGRCDHVTLLADREAMMDWLSGGAFGAVFSEYVLDQRLLATGNTPFSLRDFEMGLPGALRTLARLQRAVDLPYLERWSHHLPRRDA
jgi:hypothetical protein